MNESEAESRDWDSPLDAALAHALTRPAVPTQFRAHLQAALARESDAKLSSVRSRFEREHRERLADLEAGYYWLRRRTLAALIGGAFAAGVAVPIVLPWFSEQFGSYAPAALAAVGAAVGLCLGAASWVRTQQTPLRG